MIYITNIRLGNNGNGHEHITDLRWRDPASNQVGQSSRQQMVDFIRGNGVARVQDRYGDVAVGVVDVSPPYVRTVADGRWTDNLLALPRF